MTFDDALSNCIDLIDHGISIDQCLQQHPDYAVDLEPMLEVIAALRLQNRQRMSSAGFQQGRAAMAEKLRATVQPQSSQVVPPPINSIVIPPPTGPIALPAGQNFPATSHERRKRALPAPYTVLHAMTTAIAAAVLLLSVYSLARSVNTSLPGEPLYTAKRSVENFQGTLMTVMGESASWHAQQTKRRLRESIALQEQNRPVDADFALDIRAHVRMTINAASILPLSERQAFLNQWLSDLQQMQDGYDPTAHLAGGVTGSAPTGSGPGEEDPLAQTMQQSIRTVENAAGINPVPAVMPTATSTLTATPEPPTATSTTIPTATPSNTPTSTNSPTMTPAPTNTVAAVVPPTATQPPTVAPTVPPTATPRPTNTRDSSDDSDSDKKTATPVPPTSTRVPPTATPAPTSTNTPEATATPDPNATPTVGPTDDGLPGEGTPGPDDTPDPNATPTIEPTDDGIPGEGTPGPDDTPDPNGTPTAEPTDDGIPDESTPGPDNTSEPPSESTPGATATSEADSTPVPPETSQPPGNPTDEPQAANPAQPATPNAPAPPETEP